MKWSWFEVRFGIASLFWVPMLLQYMLLYWLEARVWRPLLYPFAVVFILENFLFNTVVGTFLFLEWPKELQFTPRIQRLVDQRDRRALRFARVLNESDKNHVKLPETLVG